MASKADRFYFENFAAAAECSYKAANYLVECMEKYEADKLNYMMVQLHTIEHEGDIKKHEMNAALAKAFVTPVDREDLALISANIDNVTDAIEEIMQALYMYEIRAIQPDAIVFAKELVKCCDQMKGVLKEFANFKKPAKLHELIVELNHEEEVCDKLYLEANKNLRQNCSDVLEIISWREIYERMEACADACEHVGDCVDTVVMKNS